MVNRFFKKTALVVSACSTLVLTSCDFVDSGGGSSHLIELPSVQYIFNNDTNEYRFTTGDFTDRTVSPPTTSGFDGELVLSWTAGTVSNPLDNNNSISLTRFNAAETVGAVSTNIVQYINQSTNPADEGSVFLHVAQDANQQLTDYWTTKVDLGTYNNDSQRESIPMLYSPFENNTGDKPESYFLMGNCSLGTCEKMANVIETRTITGVDDLQLINTDIGDFETYKIHYNVTLVPLATIGPGIGNITDFRLGCHSIDFSSQVTSRGVLFINPDVGLVRIENFCEVAGQERSYTAVLTRTTINF